LQFSKNHFRLAIMKKRIVLFQSTHNAIKAERLCLQAGIACQVIPVPREISSDCGVALEINDGDRELVEQLLKKNSIPSEIRLPIRQT
jgi:hypothetical protein